MQLWEAEKLSRYPADETSVLHHPAKPAVRPMSAQEPMSHAIVWHKRETEI